LRKAVLHLKGADPVLRAVIERVGPYRIRYSEPAFAALARSIVFQQLNECRVRPSAALAVY
jgi:3-methyladenine DNA glycosylase/8-oxoguanine DNA glycosylase